MVWREILLRLVPPFFMMQKRRACSNKTSGNRNNLIPTIKCFTFAESNVFHCSNHFATSMGWYSFSSDLNHHNERLQGNIFPKHLANWLKTHKKTCTNRESWLIHCRHFECKFYSIWRSISMLSFSSCSQHFHILYPPRAFGTLYLTESDRQLLFCYVELLRNHMEFSHFRFNLLSIWNRSWNRYSMFAFFAIPSQT